MKMLLLACDPNKAFSKTYTRNFRELNLISLWSFLYLGLTDGADRLLIRRNNSVIYEMRLDARNGYFLPELTLVITAIFTAKVRSKLDARSRKDVREDKTSEGDMVVDPPNFLERVHCKTMVKYLSLPDRVA